MQSSGFAAPMMTCASATRAASAGAAAVFARWHDRMVEVQEAVFMQPSEVSSSPLYKKHGV